MAPEHQDGAAHQGPAGLAAHKRRAYLPVIAGKRWAYCKQAGRVLQ